MKILKAGRFCLNFGVDKQAKLACIRHFSKILSCTFAEAKRICEGAPFSFSSLTEGERKELINFVTSGVSGWIYLHAGKLVRVPWPFSGPSDYAEQIREEFGFSLTPPEEDNSSLLFEFERVLERVEALIQPGQRAPNTRESENG